MGVKLAPQVPASTQPPADAALGATAGSSAVTSSAIKAM